MKIVLTSVNIAEAIRDLQSIRSLDYLTAGEQEQLHKRTVHFFPKTANSIYSDVRPFETENYRRLHPVKQAVLFDEVREILRTFLPKQVSWPEEEKKARRDLYEEGGYKPKGLSSFAERLARFIIALGGALFILIPMYIMAFDQSRARNIVTTTVAVVLFALVCSIPLRLATDQTFSATFGYAAVLMAFVSLNSGLSQS